MASYMICIKEGTLQADLEQYLAGRLETIGFRVQRVHLGTGILLCYPRSSLALEIEATQVKLRKETDEGPDEFDYLARHSFKNVDSTFFFLDNEKCFLTRRLLQHATVGGPD
jgi:hypothetical protein